jgi:hypothetical protein
VDTGSGRPRIDWTAPENTLASQQRLSMPEKLLDGKSIFVLCAAAQNIVLSTPIPGTATGLV